MSPVRPVRTGADAHRTASSRDISSVNCRSSTAALAIRHHRNTGGDLSGRARRATTTKVRQFVAQRRQAESLWCFASLSLVARRRSVRSHFASMTLLDDDGQSVYSKEKDTSDAVDHGHSMLSPIRSAISSSSRTVEASARTTVVKEYGCVE